MKCLNCGAELPEDAKFCGSCGTSVPAGPIAEETVITEAPVEPVEAPAEAAEPKKKNCTCKVKQALASVGAKLKPLADKAQPVVDKCKPFVQKNKLWIAGGACVLILLLTVLIVVSALTSGNGFTPFEHAISAEVRNDEIVILYDNKKVIKTGIEAKRVGNEQVSIDGNVLAFLTDEDKLVVVNGKKARVVAEDVENFLLSVHGDGIGYVVRDEEKNESLKLYRTSKKKSVTVTDEFTGGEYDLSPNGKSVAYYRYDSEDKESDLMYFNGSKSTKITSNVDLVGLANKGKYIYVVGKNDEGKNILFSYNTKGDKRKIGECSTIGFIFNEDRSQILFYDGDLSISAGFESKTYISTKGKEAVRISSSFATPMLPGSSVVSEGEKAVTFPTKTLYNKVYNCLKDGQYNLWLIKKNVDNSSRLATNVSRATLDESAEYVYYVNKDRNLKMLKISHGDRASDKAKLMGEDVTSYVVTSDRSKIYFVSEDALYSCNGKTGKSKRTVASEDVESTLVLNQKDICYYIVEGDLYACSNGRRGKMVIAEIEDVYASPNNIVYVETEDGIFATKTAKKPAKVLTED